MSRQQTIASALLATKTLLGRYLKGFDDTNHTRQAAGLPNHVAWCLGHCALTMQRVAEHIDGRPLSPEDFMPGPAGNADRFGLESVAFASQPRDDAAMYPRFDRCVAIFESACERLAGAACAADDAALDRSVKWGGAGNETPLHMLALRMVFHNGMHTGQIADLRRALGMGSIFA
jgi:hypothetical protein